MKKSRVVLFVTSALAIHSALAFTSVTMPAHPAAHLSKYSKGSTLSLDDLSPLLHKKYVFTLKDEKSGGLVYSTKGEFIPLREYIVQDGKRLQGYPEERGLISTQCAMSDIKLTAELPPEATTNIVASFNLDATSSKPTSPFKSDDYSTFNYRIDSTLYDKVGEGHEANFYFVKSSASHWDIYVAVDHQIISKGSILFDDGGQLQQVDGLSDLMYTSPFNGHTQSFSLTVDGATQFASPFSVKTIFSDGHELLFATNIFVDDLGYVNETFTNGYTQTVARIAISALR